MHFDFVAEVEKNANEVNTNGLIYSETCIIKMLTTDISLPSCILFLFCMLVVKCGRHFDNNSSRKRKGINVQKDNNK